MSMLGSEAILEEMRKGTIVIDPFNPQHLGANSYDLTLGDELLVYEKNYRLHQRQEDALNRGSWPNSLAVSTLSPIDMRVEEQVVSLRIPTEGLVLFPGVVYLGTTREYTETHNHVPCVEGRSSAARLGLSTHLAAGYGDRSFCASWTLELAVQYPLRVYAGIRVVQIFYTTIEGEAKAYAGKYQQQRRPVPSGLWRDFLPGKERSA